MVFGLIYDGKIEREGKGKTENSINVNKTKEKVKVSRYEELDLALDREEWRRLHRLEHDDIVEVDWKIAIDQDLNLRIKTYFRFIYYSTDYSVL